jgi:hypothetical protein
VCASARGAWRRARRGGRATHTAHTRTPPDRRGDAAALGGGAVQSFGQFLCRIPSSRASRRPSLPSSGPVLKLRPYDGGDAEPADPLSCRCSEGRGHVSGESAAIGSCCRSAVAPVHGRTVSGCGPTPPVVPTSASVIHPRPARSRRFALSDRPVPNFDKQVRPDVKIDDSLHCRAVLVLPHGRGSVPARESTCATTTGCVAAAMAGGAAFTCSACTPRLFSLGAPGTCGAQSRPAGRSRTFPTLRGHSG